MMISIACDLPPLTLKFYVQKVIGVVYGVSPITLGTHAQGDDDKIPQVLKKKFPRTMKMKDTLNRQKEKGSPSKEKQEAY